MKTFSIMEAAVEPFRLAGRRPAAPLIWGLVLLAPGLLMIGAMLPLIAELAASGAFSAEAGEAADPEDILFGGDMAAMMQFHLWSNLAQLLGLLGLLLVTTAIIRGVFAGRRGDRAFFLRIGMAELQVAVVGLAVGVGFFLVAILVVLLAVGLGIALWQLAEPWRWLLCIALGLAVCLGLLALWGRLSLLAPASVHYRTFAFEEGWKLGRGKTWSLLRLWIVLILIAIAVGIAFVTLFILVMLAVGGGLQLTDPEAVEAWVDSLPRQPPALLAAMVVLMLIPMAWLHGFSQLLFTAPFAHVVRARAGSDAPPAAVEELH